MPNSLERLSSTTTLAARSAGLPVSRRTARALSLLEERTLLRAAAVQGEEYVQTEKLHSIDRLAREAATGQAMLARWVSTLAQGDPMVADELRFFSDIAKMGKAEVLADSVDTMRRERRS